MNILVETESDRNGLYLLSELNQFTTLTPKQIRNRARKYHPMYPELIIGGGRGHKGKYWVHLSAIPMLTERRYRKNDDVYILKQRQLAERLFLAFTWNYFGCIRPAYDVDEKVLISALSGFTSFYAIHRINDTNHIHFAISTDLNIAALQIHLTAYFRKLHIRADNRQIDPFKTALKQQCFNYCVGRDEHSRRTDVVDWGGNVTISIPTITTIKK